MSNTNSTYSKLQSHNQKDKSESGWLQNVVFSSLLNFHFSFNVCMHGKARQLSVHIYN